jgi:hypothetical protein
MIKKAILFSALPAAFLFGAGALVGVQTAPAEAVIPATHAKNCFGGAVSYGTQYSLVSAGEASGQVYLEAGVNPGNSLQYYRTNVCG